jgi:RNA 2',3'-cyclic 3'-phosphodiesterase
MTPDPRSSITVGSSTTLGVVRLFVAVRPPESVVEMLLGIERPDFAQLRWTTEEQWHVTLRFLGEVDDPGPVVRALRGVPHALLDDGVVEVRAILGPTTAWFPGRQVLQVTVAGLDALAHAVLDATAPWTARADDHSFSGHLTLARTRGRASGSASLAGASLAVTWRVRAFELVSSVLGRGGPRYETVDTVPLSGLTSTKA